MLTQSRMHLRSRHYLIPFGVDSRIFRPVSKSAAKETIGVPDDVLAIGLRSVASPYKGLSDAKYVVGRLVDAGYRIALLTVDQIGHFDDMKSDLPVIDLGWIADERQLSIAYNAADVFLMPSKAEAFGVMAVEAMACGTPVVCYEGTALPETVREVSSQLVVPYGDKDSLYEAVRGLLDDVDARREIAKRARHLCESEYGDERYLRRIEQAYLEEALRRLHPRLTRRRARRASR